MRGIDLFCGAGGLSLGAEEAGVNIIQAFDTDEDSVQTYNQNQGSIARVQDVREVEVNEDVDVVIGGPPCQGFSIAGRRSESDGRNELINEFVTTCLASEATLVVMENVPGILSLLDGKYIKEALQKFRRSGYRAEYKKLRADLLGVPQRRERVFLVARKEGKPKFPRYGMGRKTAGEVLGQSFKEYPNHNKPNHSDEMKAKMDSLDYGESVHGGEAYCRIHPDEPSPTIKHNNGAPFVHPSMPRIATPRECAALQGFPNDYEFVGSKGSIYKQIANAVPPKMANKVLRANL